MKLVCNDLFKEYTEITGACLACCSRSAAMVDHRPCSAFLCPETYIERRLAEEIDGFDMAEFAEMLEARADELNGDVFDILMGVR